MLLVEQTRQLQYTHGSGSMTATGGISTPWAALTSNLGTIVAATSTAIAFNTKFTVGNGGSIRVKAGNNYIFGTVMPGGMSGSYTTISYVPAGNHIILVEYAGAGAAVTAHNFQSGYFKLKDETAVGTLGTYNGQFTVNIPARITPLGSITNAVVYVNCWGSIPAGAALNWINVGDATAVGSIRLDIDGAQVNWTDRVQEPVGFGTYAWARYIGTVTAGANHTVALTKDASIRVDISVYASPWLLPGTDSPNIPVNLDFPQNSTFYAMFEPLNSYAGTYYSKLGKKRCVSFGTETDYYSTFGSYGLQTHNYTFELAAPDSVQWEVGGLNYCVSHIGVDIR
jgi:hypothetical protein